MYTCAILTAPCKDSPCSSVNSHLSSEIKCLEAIYSLSSRFMLLFSLIPSCIMLLLPYFGFIVTGSGFSGSGPIRPLYCSTFCCSLLIFYRFATFWYLFLPNFVNFWIFIYFDFKFYHLSQIGLIFLFKLRSNYQYQKNDENKHSIYRIKLSLKQSHDNKQDYTEEL